MGKVHQRRIWDDMTAEQAADYSSALDEFAYSLFACKRSTKREEALETTEAEIAALPTIRDSSRRPPSSR